MRREKIRRGYQWNLDPDEAEDMARRYLKEKGEPIPDNSDIPTETELDADEDGVTIIIRGK